MSFTYCFVWPNIKNIVNSAGRSVKKTLPLKYSGKLNLTYKRILIIDKDTK